MLALYVPYDGVYRGTQWTSGDITKNDVELLNKIISELFESNSELHNYIGRVAVTNVSNCYEVPLTIDPVEIGESYYIYQSKTDDSLFNTEYGEMPSTAAIFFMNFGLKQLQTDPPTINRSRRNKFSNYYLGDAFKFSQMISFDKNKPSPRGPFLNFSHIHDLIRDSDHYVSTRFFEFYFCTKRNILLGFINSKGYLIFKYNAVLAIIKHCGEVYAKKMIAKAMLRFVQFRDMIEKQNMTFLNDNMKLDAFASLYAQMKSEHKDFNFTREEMKQIYKKFDYWFSSYIRKVSIPSKSDHVFRNVIKDLMRNVKVQFRRELDKAYKSGMEFNDRIVSCGWIPCSRHEVPGGHISKDGIWWKKDVNIIPNRVILNRKNYKLPEKYGKKYKVQTLYMNNDGIFVSNATHPNISSSHIVCMGDLVKIDFTLPFTEFSNMLARGEELLEIINLDSSYFSIGITAEKDLIPMDVLNSKRKIKKTSRIRKLTDQDFRNAVVSCDNETMNIIDKTLESRDQRFEPESVDLVDSGELVYNGQTIQHKSFDPKFNDYLNIVNDIQQSCWNLVKLSWDSIISRNELALWTTKYGKQIFGCFRSYETECFYMKDKYSKPVYIQSSKLNDILPFCELSWGDTKWINIELSNLVSS